MKTSKQGWSENPTLEKVEAAMDIWVSRPDLLEELRAAQANTREKLRGGARPGSGRKVLGKVAMLVKISPETREMVNQLKARTKLTQGALVEAALREYFATHRP